MRKILLIDDDDVFAGDMKLLLTGPFTITSVSGSRDGIELLEKERFDLILLDLRMPSFFSGHNELEGIKVLKMIRDKWGTDPPIIILSGTSGEKFAAAVSTSEPTYFTRNHRTYQPSERN